MLQHKDPDYANMALAIGLQFVNHEEKVADGTHDVYIDRLGDFLLSLGKRPVFLRIAYEFDEILGTTMIEKRLLWLTNV